MIVSQGAFAASTPIDRNKIDQLRALLKEMGDTVDEGSCRVHFRNFKSVHFMRWLILDSATDLQGNGLEPSLILSSNFDLPHEAHLQELVNVGGAQVQEIYRCCRDYDGKDLKSYLEKHEVPYAAFYVGTRGRSVGMIRQEQYLREEIQKLLDDPAVVSGKSKREIREAIQQHVQNRDDLKWALTSDSAETWQRYFLGAKSAVNSAAAIAVILILSAIAGSAFAGPAWFGLPWWQLPAIAIGILSAIILLPVLIIWVIERRERAQPVTAQTVGAPIERLLAREDQIVQNQLSNVVLIKPGIFRPLILRLVLSVIDFAGRVYFTRGALGGIPTIHFARWIIIDQGRRLLFLSNFDGSWENYLGDFIDKAAIGLTAIWSSTVGCPPARFLFWKGGARDEAAFKSWVRDNQLFTDVWYSAYEDLSVQNINNNSYIRLRLSGPIDDDKLTEWLERF